MTKQGKFCAAKQQNNGYLSRSSFRYYELINKCVRPEFSIVSSIFNKSSGVNVSKTNCKTMESFNIYENTQLKKAKYTNKHFLEILNTQFKFEIPK